METYWLRAPNSIRAGDILWLELIYNEIETFKIPVEVHSIELDRVLVTPICGDGTVLEVPYDDLCKRRYE